MLPNIYRHAFVQAVEILARVCRMTAGAGDAPDPPILVGGAVIEFDTGGQFMSGDFDFVTSSDTRFISALKHFGFVPDGRPGVLQRPGGWHHPTHCIGVDMVSGQLFDGRTDRGRLRMIATPDGEIHIPPTEDMIADRIGRWEASDRKDQAMRAQARVMFLLAETLDHAYLDLRIKQETAGAATLQTLLAMAKDPAR